MSPALPFAPEALVGLWLATQVPATRTTYAGAVRSFLRLVGREQLPGLLGPAATALALAFRARLLEARLSPATINVRLSALRSLVDHARRLGADLPPLEVDGLPSEPYRDTRGPGRDGFRRLLRGAAAGPAPIRDAAILWCLYGLALRRAEVAALDLEDVESGVLQVRGKGRAGARAPVSLPPPVAAALGAWTSGHGGGPLFIALRGARGRRPHGRLSPRGVAEVVVSCGRRVDLRARAHGLRHAAITDALELTNGDLRRVRWFSRHADPRTLLRYDDNRRDDAGQVAALVSSAALE